MKNILFALFVLVLLHGKGPDVEAPKEGPKGPSVEVNEPCQGNGACR